MNKLLISMLAILLIVTSFSSANTELHKINEAIDIKVPCINNGAYCSTNTTCTITITDPDSNIITNDAAMTNQESYHNYTLQENVTNKIGNYLLNVVCIDNNKPGHNQLTLEVTPTGKATSTQQGIMYLLGFAAIILLFFALIYISTRFDSGSLWGFVFKTFFLIMPMWLLVFLIHYTQLVLWSYSYVESISSTLDIVYYVVFILILIFSVLWLVMLLFNAIRYLRASYLKNKGWDDDEIKDLLK